MGVGDVGSLGHLRSWGQKWQMEPLDASVYSLLDSIHITRPPADSAICSQNSACTMVHGLYLHPRGVLSLRIITENCVKLYNEMHDLCTSRLANYLAPRKSFDILALYKSDYYYY